MAIDDATLEKLKKLDDKEKIKKLLEKIRPDLEKKFKRKKDDDPLSPEEQEKLDDFFKKFKEKKKIIPKVKPDPDKKNTPIIPKDFFKDPNRKLLPYKLPERFNPDNKRKFYENMPYKLKPSDEMPGVQLLKKGGTVKGYKAGGEVKTDKSPNSGMITKRGWGKSRKT